MDQGRIEDQDGPQAETEAAAPTVRKALVRLAAFVVLVAAALTVAYFTPLGTYLSRDSIARTAERLGWAGPLAIIAIGTITPFFFLPRWPIALVSGLLYGVLWGTLLANVASTIGAYLNFATAHLLLAPGADRLKKRFRFQQIRIPKDRAFVVLFLLRAFPLSNFVATNLVAGALRIPSGTYLSATFLGMLPSSLMYAAWGKLLKKPSSEFYLVALFTLCLVGGGTFVAHKYGRPFFRSLNSARGGSGESGEESADSNPAAGREAQDG